MGPGRALGLPASWVLPAAIFGGSFAWSFVYVSLPFYLQRISTLDAAATLRWTGWVLGITSVVTVVTSPFWGRAAGGASARRFWILVEALQGTFFFLMAVARTLAEMLLVRAILGGVGAASTFAFIIAGRSGGDVRRRVAAIQSAMTVGQVVGPLAGAVAAARLGFRESFVLGGLLLWGVAALVWRGVPEVAAGAVTRSPGRGASVREVGTVCLVVLGGSTQIFFLAAVLPEVLPGLGVAPDRTLEVGGLVIFATGVAAALGSMAAPRLGDLWGERRAVVRLLGASSVLVAALALAPGVWTFGAVRFLQVLCVAPVFPLAVGGIAQRASGEAIGFVNSSRIGAAFLGPVLATTLLAAAPPAAVYLAMAACGLGALPVVAGGRRRGAGQGGGA
jgi:MFS family permease